MATLSTVTVTEEMKRKFAAIYVRSNNNPAAAALQIIQNNPGYALQCSNELMKDAFVIAEIDRIKSEGSEDDQQPSRVDIANKILEKAQLASDPKDYAALMKLYCDVRGFIEKPGSNVAVDVKVAPVMIVRDHGSNEEWQEKLQRQQRELVADAAN